MSQNKQFLNNILSERKTHLQFFPTLVWESSPSLRFAWKYVFYRRRSPTVAISRQNTVKSRRGRRSDAKYSAKPMNRRWWEGRFLIYRRRATPDLPVPIYYPLKWRLTEDAGSPELPASPSPVIGWMARLWQH